MKDSSRVGYRRVEKRSWKRKGNWEYGVEFRRVEKKIYEIGRVTGDMEQDTEEKKRRSMEEEG